MRTGLIVLLVVAVSSTMVPHVGPVDTHVPKVYKMELNDSPEERWAPIAKDYAEPIKRFQEFIDLLVIP